MLRRLYKSILTRVRFARFGIFYLTSRSRSLASVRVAGRRVRISLPSEEKRVHEYEFGSLLFDDCYRLGQLPRTVRTVLDVGANVGLFSVTARHFFPNATIHAYEPNPSIEPYLRRNCEQISVSCHSEALGLQAGRVQLDFRENSLHSVSREVSQGDIPQTGFREALDRLGEQVDLVKLDCEGAEWLLFEDSVSWRRVRFLTMEYHLWAKPGATLDELKDRLGRLGFDCHNIEPSLDGPWGFLQASNRYTTST
jgi:FkbM family methyltransferase